jgi:hypothetical protein
MARNSKSPITAQPLRQAGQSVSEKLQDLVFEKMFSYYFVACLMWILAGLEWHRYLAKVPPRPVIATVIALLVTLVAVIQIGRHFRQAKRYKQGLRGEQAVGEYLDRLRSKGYRVIHDVPFDDWNIDHVIICERGIYTIETKTRSKPDKGKPIVTFGGKYVSVDGGLREERPIVQATAQAQTLRVLLKELTGISLPVQSVVVFPGWYVESLPGSRESQVWVLNPKSLHKWIDKRRQSISAEHVTVAAAALGKYVRKFEPAAK